MTTPHTPSPMLARLRAERDAELEDRWLLLPTSYRVRVSLTQWTGMTEAQREDAEADARRLYPENGDPEGGDPGSGASETDTTESFTLAETEGGPVGSVGRPAKPRPHA